MIFSSPVEAFWEQHLKDSEAAASQYEVGIAFSLIGLSYMLAACAAGLVRNQFGRGSWVVWSLGGYVVRKPKI